MVIKTDTNYSGIERMKKRLGLTGDVYVYNNYFIENLESHKKLIPESTATTIEEAFEERVVWEAEQEKINQELAKQYVEENYEA